MNERNKRAIYQNIARWSEDGKYFITASEKGTILRIYSIETLSLVKELRRGMDATTINDIRLSNDPLVGSIENST